MAMDPLPTINKVFSLVLQFEREFHISENGNSTHELVSLARRENINHSSQTFPQNTGYSNYNNQHNTQCFGGRFDSQNSFKRQQNF